MGTLTQRRAGVPGSHMSDKKGMRGGHKGSTKKGNKKPKKKGY